jgi:hypothetical protein
MLVRLRRWKHGSKMQAKHATSHCGRQQRRDRLLLNTQILFEIRAPQGHALLRFLGTVRALVPMRWRYPC